MFEDTLIVQSAISAFNNAALVAPAFLWWGLLAIPLFVLIYYCGTSALARIGWNENNINSRVGLITVVLTLAWVVLFGGNYQVLRDSSTVLPFAVAATVFVSALFIGSWHKQIKVPAFRGATRLRKFEIVVAWVIVLLAIGLSDMRVWWGPLMLIGAFVGGLLIGRAIRPVRPVPAVMIVIMIITTLLLMQPEFFRFGQLGALTPIHLMFLILMALVAAATVALRNVRPRGRIGHSAYVKLKWLARIIAVLCMALFVLTESVPVFLGMTVMFFIVCAMSVWHSYSVIAHAGDYAFALSLMLFGVLMTMPAITALGILRWVDLPRANPWRQFGRLL